jgi:hypothetical protein
MGIILKFYNLSYNISYKNIFMSKDEGKEGNVYIVEPVELSS